MIILHDFKYEIDQFRPRKKYRLKKTHTVEKRCSLLCNWKTCTEHTDGKCVVFLKVVKFMPHSVTRPPQSNTARWARVTLASLLSHTLWDDATDKIITRSQRTGGVSTSPNVTVGRHWRLHPFSTFLSWLFSGNTPPQGMSELWNHGCRQSVPLTTQNQKATNTHESS